METQGSERSSGDCHSYIDWFRISNLLASACIIDGSHRGGGGDGSAAFLVCVFVRRCEISHCVTSLLAERSDSGLPGSGPPVLLLWQIGRAHV